MNVVAIFDIGKTNKRFLFLMKTIKLFGRDPRFLAKQLMKTVFLAKIF